MAPDSMNAVGWLRLSWRDQQAGLAAADPWSEIAKTPRTTLFMGYISNRGIEDQTTASYMSITGGVYIIAP